MTKLHTDMFIQKHAKTITKLSTTQQANPNPNPNPQANAVHYVGGPPPSSKHPNPNPKANAVHCRRA